MTRSRRPPRWRPRCLCSWCSDGRTRNSRLPLLPDLHELDDLAGNIEEDIRDNEEEFEGERYAPYLAHRVAETHAATIIELAQDD